ncbi:glycosyltransferase family 4 protein [Cecembia lonarensis]|uniref:Mannosylfructose-phosphate synthase n=1 Tax=Cecembia lonarensis (strain CCUG 58316 / KCTC 22772 / LW9) TaxID=1225176 RepID=K1LGM1_CECL9|nr:glycosyltransferase family 4 protein [Cecembia lonarensis]EKB51327.1 Mannosylfructose-phosphate synthase [Cecembia lonarensis LW9]
MRINNVLVVAPSRKTRGGITAVVKLYERSALWDSWNCFWIETHIDKTKFLKLMYFIKAFIVFLAKLPFYNIVHIHLSEPASAVRKTFFFIPAKILRKKIILHFHSFSPDTTINSRFKRLYKFLFSNCNKLIVLSSYWKESVLNSFPAMNNVEIIYNPCAPIEFHALTAKKEKYILFAGTLNQRKGYEDLIHSFSRIESINSEWSVVFAGNGEIEKGKDLVRKLNLDNRVIFKGWVTGEEKAKLFREASIFCLPSYAEGFPMAVLDAFSYALPVIVTPVGGLPDVLKDGINSFLFAPGDIEDLSKKLNTLMQNEHLQNKFSIASRNFATTDFSLESVIEKISHLYKKL